MKRLLLTMALAACAAFAQYSTPVRDVENPVHTAVSLDFNCQTPPSTVSTCTTAYTIPAGYRLVIETITLYVTSYSTTIAPRLQLDVATDNTYASHFLNSVLTGAAAVGVHNVRMYTDSFSNVAFYGVQAGAKPALAISGHLVKK